MAKILGNATQPTSYVLMGLTTRSPPLSDDAAIARVEAAFAEGVDLWNGGEFYGPVERNSLHILNKYFTKHPDQADKITISIKGSTKPGTYLTDGMPQNVRRSIDECLRVLDGKKFLDIFQAARVDPTVPIEHTIEVIAEYVKGGKIVYKIECVEVEFSLWATEILHNSVAETCAELGIPIIAYSPLGRGFLTGQLKSPDDLEVTDFRKYLPRFQPGTFEKNLDLVHRIEKIAQTKGVTPGQIGMAWVVKQGSKPGMPTVIPIPGSSSPARVKENAVVPTLTADEEVEINKIVESAEIVGDRYMGDVEKLNFGDSPPPEK